MKGALDLEETLREIAALSATAEKLTREELAQSSDGNDQTKALFETLSA